MIPLVFLGARVAHAQQARDPAGADKLYEDGSKLLAQGDWAGACTKFAQSQQLDPSPGALLNLAGCAEHDGKIASAWSLLKEARSLNADTLSNKRQQEIEQFSAAGIARLEPHIPQLKIAVQHPPPGLRVLRDGQDVTATVGTPLPVDPGKHVIEVSAPGFRTVTETVDVTESTRPLWQTALEAEPEATVPPERPAAPPVLPGPKPVGPLKGEEGLDGLQITGLVMGGGGLAVLGASIATGVLALGKKSDLDELGCIEKEGSGGSTLLCSKDKLDTAKSASSDGSTLATVSTVTTFAGAALTGTGVVLFIIGTVQRGGDGAATKEASTAPQVLPYAGPGSVGLTVRGAF